ncbi:MAG: hypothetical protein N2747_05475 [Chitinophagaceae bacterium]|nr:hypothetical protein [Chitinophagaceae bacterium]
MMKRRKYFLGLSSARLRRAGSLFNCGSGCYGLRYACGVLPLRIRKPFSNSNSYRPHPLPPSPSGQGEKGDGVNSERILYNSSEQMPYHFVFQQV